MKHFWPVREVHNTIRNLNQGVHDPLPFSNKGGGGGGGVVDG